MQKFLYEWFGDPFFGLMLAAALIIVLSLFISSYREKLEKRRYLQYRERKRREIKEKRDSDITTADSNAPN
jgi:phosphate/sulfate permease